MTCSTPTSPLGSQPGSRPDTPPYTPPDAPPDAPPDTRPDTRPDTPPDTPPDTVPDWACDPPPARPLERASDPPADSLAGGQGPPRRWSAGVHAWWLARHPDRGQATAEYALVLLGAAMVALILVGWATGGGAGRIGSLLDRVIDAITGSF